MTHRAHRRGRVRSNPGDLAALEGQLERLAQSGGPGGQRPRGWRATVERGHAARDFGSAHLYEVVECLGAARVARLLSQPDPSEAARAAAAVADGYDEPSALRRLGRLVDSGEVDRAIGRARGSGEAPPVTLYPRPGRRLDVATEDPEGQAAVVGALRRAGVDPARVARGVVTVTYDPDLSEGEVVRALSAALRSAGLRPTLHRPI